MRTTPEILQKQWSSISYKEGGFLQVDTQHPLEWHIGYQSISQKTLLLICNTDVEVIDSSKSMLVTRRKRETDNRYTLSFELLRNEQEDVFVILCSDIIEHSRLAKDEKVALDLVINRFKQWSRLLESQKKGVMDEKRRKGLIGELLFLWERIKTSSSVLDTIQGWVGAEGLDQDFIYEDCWYEVKSIGLSATSVTISSLEQLDSATQGELVVMRIDKAAPDKAGALSLNDVVYEISLTLANSSNALDLFRSKLSAYGYIDLKEYSQQKYYCSGSQRYEVNNTFPRIMRSNIPPQVESLHYELSLPALSDWLKG
ncbi:PD-(D/E)XK motif protein [Paenibacillus sp. TC-CSREp1]|uniref:PD-(D/E)XK motif protein n=1 Tax=Paenibacillus sp. TC-CSREp1 TaxID=3410089 RepID=UPI003D0637D1